MSASKPNVIVFFTDQQRWDCSRLHGNPLDLMPNFDRMAQSGTHVYNSFTCQPVCGPARSCLQTGLYATQTGSTVNGIPLAPELRTLAHEFCAGGYTTGYIGKWHLGSTDPVPEEERGGYEYWLASNLLEFTSEPYNTVLYDNDGQPVRLPGYRVDACVDAAIRYIDKHREADQPFFLFLSLLEPHHQNHVDDYPPPPGYRERYTGRWTPPDLAALGGSSARHLGGYYGMVKRIDEALGRMLDTLQSLNLLDNTILLFTSDHGNHFKTRNAEYKRSGHESSIRVPTAFHGPGFMGGGSVRQLVSLVDLPPTLLDAARLPVPDSMAGRSILPLRRGDTAGWPDDVFVQISEAECGRAVRTQRWKYGVSKPGQVGHWTTDAASDEYAEAYLYDLEYDPYELTNLIGYESHQAVAAMMRARLLRWIAAIEGAEPDILLAESRTSGQRRVDPDEVGA
jgi:arylsulfatase A-like enzyme